MAKQHLNETTGDVIYRIAHTSDKPIAVQADEMGIPAGTYYSKLSNADDRTGLRVTELIRWLEVLDNDEVLRHLAHRRGMLLVKPPRVPKDRREGQQLAFAYQDTVTDAVRALFKFIEDGGDENREALLKAITQAAESSLSIKKTVESGNQLSLEGV